MNVINVKIFINFATLDFDVNVELDFDSFHIFDPHEDDDDTHDTNDGTNDGTNDLNDTNTYLDTDTDLVTVDNDWASQGCEYLNRRPPRSRQPRFTTRDLLSRGSCFF